jgi:hypothetical protein
LIPKNEIMQGAPTWKALTGGIDWCASLRKLDGAKRRRVKGDHANASTTRQGSRHPGDLYQAGNGYGYRQDIRQRPLIAHQKSARTADSNGATRDKAPGRLNKGVKARRAAFTHHPVRAGTGHPLVADWKGPGIAITNVAQRAGKLGIEHQNSKASHGTEFY